MFARLRLVDEDTLEVIKEESDKKGNVALFIDGEFQCSYHLDKMPENITIIENMLDTAIKYGKEARSAEILKLLGGK